MRINGKPVDDLPLREQDWKNCRTRDVAQFLQAGENVISVTVSNSLGPPALWLSLTGNRLALRSDPEWQVSLVGAAEQQAVRASEPPAIRPGNRLFGRELVINSLRVTWPELLLILLISTVVIGGSNRFLRSQRATCPDGASGAAAVDCFAVAPLVVLVVILLSWVALLGNNLPQIAALFGFDRDGHLEYIDYLLQKKALPLADEGWQMYQPPLFYLLSALIIGPFGWPASADSAVLVLRAFSALTGMVHLVLIFLCLRLVFPKQPGRQVVGLILAGFLPANLCLAPPPCERNPGGFVRHRRALLLLAPAPIGCARLRACLWRWERVWGWPCSLNSPPCWRFRLFWSRWPGGATRRMPWARLDLSESRSGEPAGGLRLALREGVAPVRHSADWQLGPPASVCVVAGPGLPHRARGMGDLAKP